MFEQSRAHVIEFQRSLEYGTGMDLELGFTDVIRYTGAGRNARLPWTVTSQQ